MKKFYVIISIIAFVVVMVDRHVLADDKYSYDNFDNPVEVEDNTHTPAVEVKDPNRLKKMQLERKKKSQAESQQKKANAKKIKSQIEIYTEVGIFYCTSVSFIDTIIACKSPKYISTNYFKVDETRALKIIYLPVNQIRWIFHYGN